MRRQVIGALLVATAWGCAAPAGPPPAGTTALAIAFERLPPIAPADGYYAAWAVTAAGPRPVAAFRPGADGAPVDLAGQPVRWTADVAPGAIRELRLTQERPDDQDGAPSDQLILAGAFDGQAATLLPPVAADAYRGRTGGFLLDNAVTDRDAEDQNGIWFAHVEYAVFRDGEPHGDVLTPGLDLDPAPPGWMYAGWLQLGGHTLRMGKFDRVDRMDDWYGFSGRTGMSLPIAFGGPPMPGEDFIAGLPAGLATGYDQPDLAGGRVIVTLESALLANEETYPSPLRIFEGEVPAAPARLVNYPLRNVAAAGLPAGRAALVP